MITLDDIRSRDDGRAFRAATVAAHDEGARTVDLAFSSETAVERWFGFEILSHDPAAVDLTRLRDGGPLLVDHDWTRQIGVVESVQIGADRRARARVRFSRNSQADEVFRDVVDGIRRHVSVGYAIKSVEKSGSRDGADEYTVTKWEPFEISIVSVPADTSVGVGRSLNQEEGYTRMSDLVTVPAAPAAPVAPPPIQPQPSAGAADDTRARVISEIGQRYSCQDLALAAIADGISVETFQARVLDAWNQRASAPITDKIAGASVGLTDREARNFSLVRVARALADPSNRRAREEAAFEFEASEAAAKLRGSETREFAIPTDVLTRALNTSTSGAAAGDTGGMGIMTNLLAQSFVEILRNRTTALNLGISLGGLVGNIDIPRQTAASQGYWLGEAADTSATNPELGQISMSPKTVGAYTDITRKLLMQSSIDIEAMVRFDLAKALALTIDRAAYYGTGSDQQPLGISGHTGIHAVSFAATQPTYAELVEMETKIALDNADVPGMAYVANAAFRGAMKTKLKFEGAAIAQGGPVWEPGGTVNGFRTEITNQIPTGDVFFGNFADLIIGLWSGLELKVDPYTLSKSGTLRIIVFQDVDFALRRVQSFSLGRH